MSTHDGGAAFPNDVSMNTVERGGMSLRQYAAIKLRVPDSGDAWLDEMIRAALWNEFAG